MSFLLPVLVSALMATALIFVVDAQPVSYIERTLGGISHGLRWMLQMIDTRDNDNRPQQQQKRPPAQIRLAVVGFGRTGSTSMYEALKQLEYTPMHDNERMETADLMAQLLDTDPKRRITVDTFATRLGDRGFDAILYYGYDFIEWCVEHNIPMVLTVRDNPQKWAESWISVVDLVDMLKMRPFIWNKSVQQLIPFFDQLLLNMTTNGKPQLYKDMDTLVDGYEKHLQRVRTMVPPHLLLEFSVKQGWGPLCEFLGKPVPSTSFPHVNDRVAMAAALATLWTITWIWPVVPIVVLYLVASFGRRLFRFCRRSDKLKKKKKT